MSLPGFNAEVSLHTSGRTYRGRYQYGHLSASQQGLPALVLPSQLEALEELEAEDEMGLIDEGLDIDLGDEGLDEGMEEVEEMEEDDNDYEVEAEEGEV
jgi:hypothetical protein